MQTLGFRIGVTAADRFRIGVVVARFKAKGIRHTSQEESSPSKPTLIEAHLELWGERGELIDTLESYTALRVIACPGDRFVLNGRPIRLRMVLDQGYWPESG